MLSCRAIPYGQYLRELRFDGIDLMDFVEQQLIRLLHGMLLPVSAHALISLLEKAVLQ